MPDSFTTLAGWNGALGEHTRPQLHRSFLQQETKKTKPPLRCQPIRRITA